MIRTTKPQRQSLKRVYDRIVADVPPSRKPPSYRQFRQTVAGSFGCIMVPFAGMWLGIEPDGYTHS